MNGKYKTKELKNIGQCKSRHMPDGWLITEFDDINSNFVGASKTRNIIFLDNLVSARSDIVSGFAEKGSKGLFCLVETNPEWDYDSPRKSDRIICGKDEDEVIKFSNEHHLF